MWENQPMPKGAATGSRGGGGESEGNGDSRMGAGRAPQPVGEDVGGERPLAHGAVLPVTRANVGVGVLIREPPRPWTGGCDGKMKMPRMNREPKVLGIRGFVEIGGGMTRGGPR